MLTPFGVCDKLAFWIRDFHIVSDVITAICPLHIVQTFGNERQNEIFNQFTKIPAVLNIAQVSLLHKRRESAIVIHRQGAESHNSTRPVSRY
jgi:hypothetical protein